MFSNETPSFWIPEKVMIHRVLDEDDENERQNAMKKWKSGGEFRTPLGELKRGALGKKLRNELANYLV
jgi:hypothetical protein